MHSNNANIFRHLPKVRKSDTLVTQQQCMRRLGQNSPQLRMRATRRGQVWDALKGGNSTFWNALKPKCMQSPFSWLSLCWIGKGCDTFSWPECKATMFSWLPGSGVFLGGARGVSLLEVPLSMWLWVWPLMQMMTILTIENNNPNNYSEPSHGQAFTILGRWQGRSLTRSSKCPHKHPFICSQDQMLTLHVCAHPRTVKDLLLCWHWNPRLCGGQESTTLNDTASSQTAHCKNIKIVNI